MESALTTTPPYFSARSSASADLPLAVGPAISTALRNPDDPACMSLVATLICNPANPALDSTIVDGALAILPSPGPAQWLFGEVAGGIPFERKENRRALPKRPREARGEPPPAIGGEPLPPPRQKTFFPPHGSPP